MKKETQLISLIFTQKYQSKPIIIYILAILHQAWIKTSSLLPISVSPLRVFDLKQGNYIEIEVKPKNDQLKRIEADARGKSIKSSFDLFSNYVRKVISENHIYAMYQEGNVQRDDNGQLNSCTPHCKYMFSIGMETP